MTETQSFTINILKIVPDNSVCYIQAPSVDKSEILNLLQPSDFDYHRQITLTPENKSKLIDIITAENIETYFQSLDIKHDDSFLFKAYDGMLYSEVSNKLNLPAWFRDKYSEILMISKEW